MPRTAPILHNASLGYLHAHWGALKGSLTPGTRRPMAALDPWLTLEPEGPGKTPAPLHIDSLDLLLDIQTDTRGWLEEAGALPLGRMPAPIVQLDQLLYLSRRKAGQWVDDVQNWATITAARVRHRLDGTLGGQTLNAPCPICGTERSLRVRVLELTTHNEPYLACESGTCTPPEGYCSNFLGNTPVWPMADWEWFAHLLTTRTKGVKK